MKVQLKAIFYLVSTILILALSIDNFAQEKVDEIPSPKGGLQTIMKNVVYPSEAKEQGIEGKVFIKAIVNQDGKVIKAEVIKSANKLLDEAAVKAIKKTEFVPATKNNKSVKAEVIIPINFKLNDKKEKE
jgi:protein TonB